MRTPERAEKIQKMKFPIYVFAGGHSGSMVVVVISVVAGVVDGIGICGHIGHSQVIVVVVAASDFGH
jgi:hypothetical protein